MSGRASLLVLWFVATAGVVMAAPDSRRVAVVETDGVELRSGHAMSFASVGQLRKGDKVIVFREEETGFLAIQPPPGTISWIRQIHLGKVEPNETGKSNVTVLVEGAEVMAGNDKGDAPLTRVTTRLPKGTLVEVTGKPVRVEGASWYPVTPPEGDLRWVPKSAVRSQEMSPLASPAPYYQPDPPAFTVSGSEGSKATTEGGVTKPAVGTLPKALTDHKLWSQASQAERSGDHATAKSLYARIYQDLWDQKAERDAIVIVYNRFTRCDEILKKGDPAAPRRSESRMGIPVSNPVPEDRPRPAAAPQPQQGKGTGYLQELQKVFVDGQQVYSFQDDKGNVTHYATGVEGMNLRGYVGKRVMVFGEVVSRPELYRPHIAVDRVEVVK
ncbi:SH3 domain-containing protein [Zavarzinella formosa]|uniref:hypothetical protein n=1 Tax=Zavarzinella formosa TaxID=360055 RepID=UPI0002E20883|nr:hypothetical protein [Zavarzinella formosa]